MVEGNDVVIVELELLKGNLLLVDVWKWNVNYDSESSIDQLMKKFLVFDSQRSYLDLYELHFTDMATGIRFCTSHHLKAVQGFLFFGSSQGLFFDFSRIHSINFQFVDSVNIIVGRFLIVLLEGRHILLWNDVWSMKRFPCYIAIEGLIHLITKLLTSSQDPLQLVLIVESVIIFVNVDNVAVVLFASKVETSLFLWERGS